MNGQIISFNGGDRDYRGYLSRPASGSGPGVIVIQEWWGLVDHIKDVCDRFAAEGFVALAPDLYFGEETTEPTRAGEMMMALSISETEGVLARAVQALLKVPGVQGDKVGVIGFCMGGQLALYAATHNPEIGACVDFYGVHPNVHPALRELHCPLMVVIAEHDDPSTLAVLKATQEELTLLGKDHCFFNYPGTHHAFFNDTRPEVYDAEAAKDAWSKTLDFLRSNLT